MYDKAHIHKLDFSLNKDMIQVQNLVKQYETRVSRKKRTAGISPSDQRDIGRPAGATKNPIPAFCDAQQYNAGKKMPLPTKVKYYYN